MSPAKFQLTFHQQVAVKLAQRTGAPVHAADYETWLDPRGPVHAGSYALWDEAVRELLGPETYERADYLARLDDCLLFHLGLGPAVCGGINVEVL